MMIFCSITQQNIMEELRLDVNYFYEASAASKRRHCVMHDDDDVVLLEKCDALLRNNRPNYRFCCRMTELLLVA